MPRRAAPRPTDVPDLDTHQQSPIPSSSDPYAQNIARLRTHWKWAALSQFFFTFSHLLAMDDVSLSDIEEDLARDTNIFLPRVMTRLLFVLSYDRKVSSENWQSALRKQHKRRDPASNPIGPEPGPEPRYRYESVPADDPTPGPAEDTGGEVADGEQGPVEKDASAQPSGSRANTEEQDSRGLQQDYSADEEAQESTDWLDLPMLTKLDSMHLLTEWQFQNPTRLRNLMKSDDEDATWRIEPIGYDAKTNAYWLIGADRLWIQRAPPKPPRYTATTSPLKRKRIENAPKLSTAKPKRQRLASDGPSKLVITVPGGGRAAKAQAKLKLESQATELADLNRTAGGKNLRGRTSVAPLRPLGTRVSARLRGAEEDEWQAMPHDWLEEEEGEDKTRASEEPIPKMGLKSDDGSISDLTELSEEPIDDAEKEEPSIEAPAGEEMLNNREDAQPDGFVEWETICVTLSDWEHIADQFAHGTHYTERALYKVLVKEIVPVITEELREIERKKRLEEAIVHRKRSSRIANKESEKEEARLLARQKAEVAEKKNRAQRLEARLAKEDAERERREAAREQRRKEKGAQEVRSTAEEESAEMVVDVVGSNPPPTRTTRAASILASDLPRRNGTHASASTSGTRTPIGEDWTLNCEICHRSGTNVDDGIPMFSCGLCFQWQHIACHDRTDRQAGRPQRNWDQVEFVCRQCQTRRVATSRQYPQQLSASVPNPYVPQPPIIPSTSYAPYGHGSQTAVSRSPREHTSTYPIALNGTAHAQANVGTSRQLSYPTASPAGYHPLAHPAATPPLRLSGPTPGTQQQYPGNYYDRSPSQLQHITASVNGPRAPTYQHPVANGASGRMPQAGYATQYSNGVTGHGDSERRQYGDGVQWQHAGGSQQTAASGYRQY